MKKVIDKKAKRKKFEEKILPKLKKEYRVIKYKYFVKIIGEKAQYDYYPGAERLYVLNSGTSNYWIDLDLSLVYNYFQIQR